jgi:hypothetical protein
MRIVIPGPIDRSLEAHLGQRGEQLAFMGFQQDGEVLAVDDLLLITADLLESKDPWHVELAAVGQQQVLRWAHERASGLVEIHTHGGLWPAEFSSIDLGGLVEWAPNMVWRLGGRPYGALVVAGGSIDGLVWRTLTGGPEVPSTVERSGESQHPTGLSLLRLSENEA